jgi:hypothetical protein
MLDADWMYVSAKVLKRSRRRRGGAADNNACRPKEARRLVRSLHGAELATGEQCHRLTLDRAGLPEERRMELLKDQQIRGAIIA